MTTVRNFPMLAVLALTNSAQALQTVHINVGAVDALQQTVRVNQPLPKRFVARVTLDDGAPVAGVNLVFSVNACLEFSANAPGTPPCPDPALYGHFAGDALPVVATAADGTATSPSFVAGSLGGTYTVYVSQPAWSQDLNGRTLTYMPQSMSNLYQVTQVAGAIGAVPFVSVPAALALALLIGLAGFLRSRRRKVN